MINKKNQEVKTSIMKSIAEIIGGGQQLFSFFCGADKYFEENLTEEHKTILASLSIIESGMTLTGRETFKRGRPSYNNKPFFRALLSKSILKIPTTKSLIQRLKADSSLRKICGFTKVPSEATFSRLFFELAKLDFIERNHESMINEYVSKKLVGHISRDSTAIESREKVRNKKINVVIKNKKRGRPLKGQIIEPKELKRLEKQINESPEESLKSIDKDASWGCKKNSQGNVSFWKGYKVHLDVSDLGIPITAVVTGANVHDSQLAIPMEKITESRVSHLYSLMDAAYDSEPIKNFINDRERKALIDPNKRRKKDYIKLNPAEKNRFKERSTVERTNSHLKDWFLTGKIFVKGIIKVTFHLMIAIIALTAIKIIQHFIIKKN